MKQNKLWLLVKMFLPNLNFSTQMTQHFEVKEICAMAKVRIDKKFALFQIFFAYLL